MLALVIRAAADAPDPNKVVAGWTAFWIFIALIAAVAFLCWNFTKQLRKTQRAKEQGVFGDAPVDTEQAARPAADEPHDADL